MDGQEKLQDLNKVFTPEETFPLLDGLNGICDVPRGWMAKEKQQNLKENFHSGRRFSKSA